MRPTHHSIRLAIADDNKLNREGIIALLSVFPEYSVHIEATNGKELLHKLETHRELLPDVCLINISMPEMNGYNTLKHVKSRWPALKVLIISTFDEELTVIKVMQNGADGYLTKDCGAYQIHEGIQHIMQKGFYHTDLVSNSLMHSLKENKDDMKRGISDREIKFLSLCCTDLTYQEIAKELFISTSTAEKLRDAFFARFNVRSRVGLATFVLKSGLYYLQS